VVKLTQISLDVVNHAVTWLTDVFTAEMVAAELASKASARRGFDGSA